MPNRFPATIQSAVLFEKRGFFDRCKKLNLEELASAYIKLQAAKSGHRYNVVEHNKGKFIRLYGGEDLMICLELIDAAANPAVFRDALGSSFTTLGFPEAAATIQKHASHLLINIRHGVMPDVPELSSFLKQIAMPQEGYSLEQFRQRLHICAMLTSLAHDLGDASLVHWTQSNMLLRPKAFESDLDVFPHLWHVHPLLYQNGVAADGRVNVGLTTFGAQHFIGREIRMLANPIPWVESYQAALAFIKLATQKNGYIIPNGDNFGVEGGDFSYRVNHIASQNSGEVETPGFYELELRYSRTHHYKSPKHNTDGEIVDTRNPPPELINTASPEGKDMLDLWESKRKRAEAAGIEFQVTAPTTGESSVTGGPRVFGKRH